MIDLAKIISKNIKFVGQRPGEDLNEDLIGEDELLYDENSDFAVNSELAKKYPEKKDLKKCRGIEVGHIFQLGTKYSEAMKAEFINESGKSNPLVMGCYGIGVSRIVAAAIEQGHDDRGIIFPDAIAPFEVVITPIGYDKNNDVKSLADSIYNKLLDLGCDVILDDRGLRPGIMFSEAELIGIPHRLTISERLINEKKVEYKNRQSDDPVFIDEDKLTNYMTKIIGA